MQLRGESACTMSRTSGSSDSESIVASSSVFAISGATGAQHVAQEVLPVERRGCRERAHQRRHLRRVGVRAGDAADRAVAVEQVHHRVVGEVRQRGARDRVERARRIQRLPNQLSDAQQQVALLIGDDAVGDVVDVRRDPFRRREDADVEPLIVKEVAFDEPRRPALVHRAPQEQLVRRAAEGREHRPERLSHHLVGIDVGGTPAGARIAVEPDDAPLAVVGVERLAHAVQHVLELCLTVFGRGARQLLGGVKPRIVDCHAGTSA